MTKMQDYVVSNIRENLTSAEYWMEEYVKTEIAKSLIHEEKITSNTLSQQMALQLFLLKEILCNIEDIH